MKKISLIGGGFLADTSTCSDYKPKKFDWTYEDHPVKVFVDSGVITGMSYQKKLGEKKIAWICESRAIFHSWYVPVDVWEHNIERIANAYDLLLVSDKQWLGRAPNIQYCPAGSNLPWIKDQAIHPKTKLVSMVASNKRMTYGHELRHEVAERFKDQIDVFGGAADSSRVGTSKEPWKDKEPLIIPYMFSVVIENDKYNTYYTEKLTDCFATGTVPIYWGPDDIGTVFNEDGIIRLTSDFDPKMLTRELYESKMEAIKDNFERVKNLESADDQLHKIINEH